MPASKSSRVPLSRKVASNPADTQDLKFSPEELEGLYHQLVSLTSQEGWVAYTAVLRRMAETGRESGFEDREQIDFWAGYVAGLKQAYGVLQVIAQQKEQADHREEAVEEQRRAVVRGDNDLSI